MQGLISHPDRPLNDRSMRAFVAILERLREDEARARTTRLRLASELGFDARHPSDVKVGDVIRVPSGNWFQVVEKGRYSYIDPSVTPYWKFTFADGEGSYEIDDWSEDAPISPHSVLVASPDESNEPF